jgi:hypothetical protein
MHANKELSQTEPPAHGVEIELPGASDQSKRAAALKKQLVEKIRTEPAASSRLVQTWMRETEKKK